jgi:DNA-binding response OmpR family regulator
MTRLLVVEDEQHLAEGLRFNLEQEGYQVDLTDNGEDALEMLVGDDKRDYALVVLDVMLPGINGFEVVEEMRRVGQYVPTLILTARGHSDDVLKGFAAGADDYLVKPFDLDILIARIRGLLRRGQWLKPASPAQPVDADTFEFGGKSVHFDLLEIHAGEEVYKLTLMEMNVLRYLIRNAGKPVARGQMLEAVWGLREDTDTRALDNFIVRLRRYIEPDPSKPQHLLAVRGVGYKFVANPEGDATKAKPQP